MTAEERPTALHKPMLLMIWYHGTDEESASCILPRGKTQLPDCVWKRACPVCGDRAVCFGPKATHAEVSWA